MTNSVGGPIDPRSDPRLNAPQAPQQPPQHGPGMTPPPPAQPPANQPLIDALRDRTQRGVDAVFGKLGAQQGSNVPPRPPLPPQAPYYGGPPAGAPQAPVYGAPPVPPGAPPQAPYYGAPPAPQRPRPPVGQGRLAQLLQSPQSLVEKGGNVRAVAQTKGISDPMTISSLEAISVQGPAGRRAFETGNFMAAAQEFGIFETNNVVALRWCAVQGCIARGEKVASAAQRYGITDDASLTALQQYALESLARRDVVQSPQAHYEAVAERYGLSDANRETLRGYAAMAAVERHHPLHQAQMLDQVARQYGFDVPELKWELAKVAALQRGEPVGELANRLVLDRGQQFELERRVIQASAGPAVARGENVLVVASRHGITVTVTSLLEDAAIEGAAGHALRGAGALAGDVQAIANHYGISPARASLVAARAAVAHGYNVNVMAQRYGITDPYAIQELGQICTDGPAAMAVRQPNATVEGVAQYFGLTNPDHVERLTEIKASSNG